MASAALELVVSQQRCTLKQVHFVMLGCLGAAGAPGGGL